MRGQHPILASACSRIGQQIERIGINHQRRRCRKHSLTQGPRPIGTTQSGADSNDVRSLQVLIEIVRLLDGRINKLGATTNNGRQILRCTGHGDEPGAGTQRCLARQT